MISLEQIRLLSGAAMLTISCLQDLRRWKIRIGYPLAFMLEALLLGLLEKKLLYVIVGMVPGIFLLLVSRITGGKIGAGDGLILMAVGGFTGAFESLSVLLLGLLLAGGFSIMMILIKKWNRKTKFPFVPFLTAAYVMIYALGKGF